MARSGRGLRQHELSENRLSGGSFSETAHFNRGNQGYLNLWGVNRGYLSESTSLARARVLGMPHLHKEKFQLLLDMTL